jgi:hypothetical protein
LTTQAHCQSDRTDGPWAAVDEEGHLFASPEDSHPSRIRSPRDKAGLIARSQFLELEGNDHCFFASVTVVKPFVGDLGR